MQTVNLGRIITENAEEYWIWSIHAPELYQSNPSLSNIFYSFKPKYIVCCVLSLKFQKGLEEFSENFV